MKYSSLIFTYILVLNIAFLSVAKAQNSYILRNNHSIPTSMPPLPPSIKPNVVEVKKKPVPTNNPSIEAAKSPTKITGDRDSNPSVGDINPAPSSPKLPKNVENKPKPAQETATNSPKNPSPKTPATSPAPKNTNANSSTTMPPKTTNTSPAPKNTTSTNTSPNPNANTNTASLPPKTSSPTTNTELTVSAEVAAKNAKLLRVAVDTALTYIGTKYLTGGMSREGVDCSGLVNLAYKNTGVKMPRTSRDLSEFGSEIKEITSIKVGDLLFFDSNDAKRINHVAMVVRVTPEQIWFIHATCSKGVREDKLIEGYWTPKHRKTMRVLLN